MRISPTNLEVIDIFPFTKKQKWPCPSVIVSEDRVRVTGDAIQSVVPRSRGGGVIAPFSESHTCLRYVFDSAH